MVNIAVPRLKIPKMFRIRLKKSTKKLLLAGGIVCMVLGLSFFGFILNDAGKTDGKKSAKGGVFDSSSAQKPDYATVLPAGKTIEDLGGWQRVSPPDKEPVFAYADHIGQAQITVSQQPLPEGFRQDAGSIGNLAQQFTANERIDIQGKEAYVGTSIRGPQSVIFSTDELLILVKSDSRVTNENWQEYLKSLQME